MANGCEIFHATFFYAGIYISCIKKSCMKNFAPIRHISCPKIPPSQFRSYSWWAWATRTAGSKGHLSITVLLRKVSFRAPIWKYRWYRRSAKKRVRFFLESCWNMISWSNKVFTTLLYWQNEVFQDLTRCRWTPYAPQRARLLAKELVCSAKS